MGFLIRLLVPVAFALSLFSCATSGYYPSYDLNRTDLQAWFAEAKTLVEDDRNLSLANVSISTVSSREMLFVLSDLYGKKIDPNMTPETRVRVFADKAFNDVDSTLAIYNEFDKRIVINQPNFQSYIGILSSEGIAAKDSAMTILIHELVHAADDAEFDLSAIERRHVGDTLGVRMVAEGHAELQTEKLCARVGCQAAFRAAQMMFHGAEHEDFDQSVLSSANTNTLLYVQGKSFLKDLLARDTSGQLVRQALTNPPGDVLEFFDADGFPDRQRAAKRSRIYSVLEGVELKKPGASFLAIPAPVFTEFRLPENKALQVRFLENQRQEILASGSMTYINQRDQDLKGVEVLIYEAASPADAKAIQDRLIKRYQSTTNEIKSVGVGVSFPDKVEQQALTGDLPRNAQRYAATFGNSRKGETIQVMSTLIIEGSHLLVVANAGDHELNTEAFLESLRLLRRAI